MTRPPQATPLVSITGIAPSPGPVLVLVEPQDIVNIASAVRIAKNFLLGPIRLVRPRVFDAYRIEGIAHNTADVVEQIELHDDLGSALGDCVYSVALTARERAAKRRTLTPWDAARELTQRRVEGPVAMVAGREDKGLTNAELDSCHGMAVIPTSPAYRSLNLAQAVAIMSYEVWRARTEGRVVRKPPRRAAGPAPGAQLDQLFADWERALWAIDFFKTRQPDAVMRSLREMVFRADLDGREAALFRAMGIEVYRYLERVGAPVAGQKPSENESER
jgi:TrmH family RNA methyltransferase